MSRWRRVTVSVWCLLCCAVQALYDQLPDETEFVTIDWVIQSLVTGIRQDCDAFTAMPLLKRTFGLGRKPTGTEINTELSVRVGSHVFESGESAVIRQVRRDVVDVVIGKLLKFKHIGGKPTSAHVQLWTVPPAAAANASTSAPASTSAEAEAAAAQQFTCVHHHGLVLSRTVVEVAVDDVIAKVVVFPADTPATNIPCRWNVFYEQ